MGNKAFQSWVRGDEGIEEGLVDNKRIERRGIEVKLSKDVAGRILQGGDRGEDR